MAPSAGHIILEQDLKQLCWLAEQMVIVAPEEAYADDMLLILEKVSETLDATPVLRRLVELKKRKDAEGEFPGYREQKDLAWREAEMILSASGSPGV